jgi:protein involved in polysaccharide export with SLBB domain
LTVPGLYDRAEIRPIRVRVMAGGEVALPLVGAIPVAGLNLSQAQQKIDAAYGDGFLVNPRVNLALAEKGTIDVVVLGAVRTPGVVSLPKFQNDIAHALASAGGLDERAAEVIEVHRCVSGAGSSVEQIPAAAQGNTQSGPEDTTWEDASKNVLRIPLRGSLATVISDHDIRYQEELSRQDVLLKAGDVVIVPRRQDEVFFVVGPLSRSNVVNFSVRDRDRQLGNAFLLPNDRDIDVVTAVAMAGYIDPIDSPSTVTVHRTIPGQPPMMIRVDLMAARYDWNENLYVEPGDIIYLNPDAAWWFRRTLDRVVPALLTVPYARAMRGWIFPNFSN